MVFLDYDGTLTPIINDPEKATMSSHMREVLSSLSQRFDTAIVTGRSREKITAFVQLDSLFYAASHGFDLLEPKGSTLVQGSKSDTTEVAAEFLPCLAQTRQALEEALVGIDGAFVEDNVYVLSVHYRQCANHEEVIPRVKAIVENAVLNSSQKLRITTGKCVFELRPAMEWDKGRAVQYLMNKLGYTDPSQTVAVYIGDDTSDEAAFAALGNTGVSVLVSDVPKETQARYSLQNPDEVEAFLQRLLTLSDDINAKKQGR